jgi:hypothetical protein
VGHSRNKRGNEKVPGTYKNLQDTAKAVLRGKFIAMSAYNKGQENVK